MGCAGVQDWDVGEPFAHQVPAPQPPVLDFDLEVGPAVDSDSAEPDSEAGPDVGWEDYWVELVEGDCRTKQCRLDYVAAAAVGAAVGAAADTASALASDPSDPPAAAEGGHHEAAEEAGLPCLDKSQGHWASVPQPVPLL